MRGIFVANSGRAVCRCRVHVFSPRVPPQRNDWARSMQGLVSVRGRRDGSAEGAGDWRLEGGEVECVAFGWRGLLLLVEPSVTCGDGMRA